MMKLMVIQVYFPDTVSDEEIKEYAHQALERWGGSRHPDDHLFGTVLAPQSTMRIGKNRVQEKPWMHSS